MKSVIIKITLISLLISGLSTARIARADAPPLSRASQSTNRAAKTSRRFDFPDQMYRSTAVTALEQSAGVPTCGRFADFEKALPLSPSAVSDDAARDALEWLRGQQQDNGSFLGSLGTYVTTNQAIWTLAIAGTEQYPWTQTAIQDALAYLEPQVVTQTDELVWETSGTAHMLMAIALAGEDPTDFGGVDLKARLTREYYDSATGIYGLEGKPLDQCWSMLAISALGQPIPDAAVQKLKEYQTAEGGWPWSITAPPDVDVTTIAIEALVAAGEPATSTAFISATNFLKSYQHDNGGFASSDLLSQPNSNSTAWVIQAIYALGQSPTSAAWTKNGNNPIDYLLSLQDDAGYFEYNVEAGAGNADTMLTTIQAIPALLGKPLPPINKLAIGDVAASFDAPNSTLSVTARYAHDVDADARAEITYRVADEQHEWAPAERMTRTHNAFVWSKSGLSLGAYEVQVSYEDADGTLLNSAQQTRTYSFSAVYLPALLKF